MLSPFAASATRVESLPTSRIAEMYRQRCGIDITPHFKGAATIDLYECSATGYRFWRPENVAGDESFYLALSRAWPEYYRTDRWEYAHVARLCRPKQRLLEIGCGRGHFLRRVEPLVREAVGLELNREAIEQKASAAPIFAQTIEDFAAAQAVSFDIVCSFQVLEHVVDPNSFLKSALACVKPGGLLAVSTPNRLHVTFAKFADPFDMPPHHMGQFDRDVYDKLGGVLGAPLWTVIEEPRTFQLEEASERTRGRATYRFVRSVVRALASATYRLHGEPGPALLAVFRKPEA